MNPEVVLLTDSDGFFGQRLMPWESLDVDILAAELSRQFSVRRMTYEEIAGGRKTLRNATIIHSSSQRPEYKAYIEDILLFLLLESNRLIPSFSAVRAHENKGFQELYKRHRSIEGLDGLYFCGEAALPVCINFPMVFKDTNGFGSSGVHLVRNQQELAQRQQAQSRSTLAELAKTLKSEIGYLVRKWILRKKNLRPWGAYYHPQKRFVVQKFVPALQCDYKVIVTRRRAFALKRLTRAGDFRASGSGRFLFEEPPDGLLDFALSVLHRLNEPYASLDVAVSREGFYLLEYQNVHFGPYTIVKAPVHFLYDGSKWSPTDESIQIERLIAESFIDYFNTESSTDVFCSNAGLIQRG
jgi:hypothetical protein